MGEAASDKPEHKRKLEAAQERGRELQAEGKLNIRIEVKEVEQPSLAYITYDEPDPK